MADDAKPEGAEGKPKKKVMLLAIVGVLVLVIAGGGFFAYTKLLGHKPAATEAGAEGGARAGGEAEAGGGGEKEKKGAEEKEGEMFELEPFVVNLSDPKAKRFLKVKVTLELESPEAKAKAEKQIPKMRDMVIMMLTSLSFEEVMTPEGKIRIRDELLERFNLILRPQRVRGIFFTEFVIQ